MLTAPSAEFTTAASADIRFPRMKIEALWTDPFVQSGNIVTSDNVNNFGDLDGAVVDDFLLQTADTKIATPHKYVINDGTFISDGTFYPVPSTVDEAAYNQVGWYTDGVGDAEGDFGAPQELVITFGSERTVNQILVAGEPTLGEYPTDFDVYIYDASNNILNTVQSFVGVSVETLIDFSSDEIITATSMKLVLNSWSASNTIGKIVEFFGVVSDTFYSDDLVSMDVLEELEADNGSPFGTMSSNELNVEFQNVSIEKDGATLVDPFIPENSASYLKNSITPNVRLIPYIGFMFPVFVPAPEGGARTYAFSYHYIPGVGVYVGDTIRLYFVPTGFDAGSGLEFYYPPLAESTITITNLSEEIIVTDSIQDINLFDVQQSINWGAFSSIGTYTCDYVEGTTEYQIEYVKMGVFWSTSWDVSESSFSASVTARDRLELLRNNDFAATEILIDYTLKEIAEYILNRAKVDIPLNDLEWDISITLDNYSVGYCWLGELTYFEALNKIASACMGRCFCDRDGKIIMQDYTYDNVSGSPVITITADDFFDMKRKSNKIKNHITVPVCPMELSADVEDVYESDPVDVASGVTTITQNIRWENDVVMEHAVEITEETGVTMVKTGEMFYPNGVDVTFGKISASGSSGTFEFKVTGKKLISVTNEPPSVAFDQASINLYHRQQHKVSENHLIQTASAANTISSAMLLSLSDSKRDVEVEVQGNPCTEIGDIASVVVYSKQDVFQEVRIVGQQFKCDKTGLRNEIRAIKTIAYGD